VHSGQESAGIVVAHGDNAHNYEQHRMMGLVTNIFTKEVLMKMKGNLGIGNSIIFVIVVFLDISTVLKSCPFFIFGVTQKLIITYIQLLFR